MGLNAQQGVNALGLLPSGDRANGGVIGSFSAIGPGLPFQIFGSANALIYASVSTSLAVTAGSLSATLGSATGLAVGAAIYSPAGAVPPGTTIGVLVSTTATLALPTLTLPGKLLANGQITGLASVRWLQGATVTGPGLPAAGLTVISTQSPPVTQRPGMPVYAPPGAQVFANQGGSVQLSGTATPVGDKYGGRQEFQFSLAAAGLATLTDSAAVFTGAGVTFSATIQLERSFDGGLTFIVCNVGGSGTMAQYSAGTPVSATFAEPEEGVTYRWNCIAYTSGTINYRISTTGAAATVNQLS